MGDQDVIKDTNFTATTQAALKEFEEALAKRWRKRVADDLFNRTYDFPKAFHRVVDGERRGRPAWDYTHPANETHLIYGSCAYMSWAAGSQDADLSSVSCPGRTPGTAYVNGSPVTIPEQISCGMGLVLEEVGSWAWQEAHEIFLALPKFDAHDQNKLLQAAEALRRIGAVLGLEAGAGSEVPFTVGSNLAAPLRILVNESGQNPAWWEAWTGLAANAFKSGFYTSVEPTIHHQAAIAASLANLVTLRSGIVDRIRHSELAIIGDATIALGEMKTDTTTTSHMASWRVGTAIGDTLAVIGLFWKPVMVVKGAAAALGTVIKLIATTGSLLNPSSTSTKLVYSNDFETAIGQIWTNIDKLKQDLRDSEDKYNASAKTLRDRIYEVNSFDLELYDLTENHAEGSGDHLNWHIEVDTVMSMANSCFECAEIYEDEVIPLLADAEAGEADLADEDGDHAWSDTNVIEVLVEFRGYLTTACGRFYLAGEEVKAAAESYSESDEANARSLERLMESWHHDAAPSYAGEWAGDTDRNSYEEASDRAPGQANQSGIDYETELSGG